MEDKHHHCRVDISDLWVDTAYLHNHQDKFSLIEDCSVRAAYPAVVSIRAKPTHTSIGKIRLSGKPSQVVRKRNGWGATLLRIKIKNIAEDHAAKQRMRRSRRIINSTSRFKKASQERDTRAKHPRRKRTLVLSKIFYRTQDHIPHIDKLDLTQ